MKLTHKLCGAVLLASVGVALAIPSTTKAVDPDPKATGDMDIQFTRPDENGSGTLPPNSEFSGSGSISLDIPKKNFGVRYVSPLEFGEAQATATERTFWAKKWNVTQETGSLEAPNHVLFTDERSVLDHTYQVTAQITSPLKTTIDGSEHTLTGSELRYRNLNISTTTADAIALSNDSLVGDATIVESGPEVIVDNSVANNPTKTKGQGDTYVNFGRLTDNTAENSVSLTIGADQTIAEGKYKGVVTWNITVAPTAP